MNCQDFVSALDTYVEGEGQKPDLEHTLSATVDNVMEVLAIDGGWIQLLDEDAGVLSLIAQRGFSRSWRPAPRARRHCRYRGCRSALPRPVGIC